MLFRSGPMHVTERLRLIAPSKLEIGKTIEDPVTLTEPYSYARTYTRHREWMVLEEICLQNNRDLSDAGRQQFDLTPPPELKK